MFYHFVATTDEDGHGPGVFALLDDQHMIFGGTEGNLLHHTCCSKLFCCQLAESGHDAASCCYGNQLEGRAFKPEYLLTYFPLFACQHHMAIKTQTRAPTKAT